MRKRLFLLAFASAAAFGGTISTVGQTNVSPVDAIDLTGFTTTGNMMGGMVIVGDFASGDNATCTWVNGGGTVGGCNSTGGGGNSFSLSLDGDTFSANWNLFNILGANLVSLTFNGLLGDTVFDRTAPSPGTDGSSSGFDALGTTSIAVDGQATYQNLVGTKGAAPVTDLYGQVFITFVGGSTDDGLSARSTATWVMDTDNIGLRNGDPGSTVPEPSTFGMVGVALVGLSWLRRSRK